MVASARPAEARGENESGQHVGLEIRQFLGSRWSPVLPQIPGDRQLHNKNIVAC
jgi:hypothetical protein